MNSPEYPSIQTQCLPQEQKDGEDGVASVIPQAKQDVSDHLQTYERLLAQRNIPPKARPYFLRWAITWCATVSSVNASSTEEFFHEQGRRPGLKAWQFQQGVRAVALLARDLLGIPWAQSYDWGGLADTAKPLEADHRTLGRESIPVAPAISSRNIIIDASSGEGKPLPETAEEVSRISEALRRAIRRNGLSYSTEQTYVGWNARFTRFCLLRLKQAPQDAGPQGITDYLNYLALKRNVSASTQRQALNAMVFLTRKVFEQPDFILEKPTPGRPRRRPPVVLTRAEIQSLIAFLENPWKLAAQLMYGSGLRLMEALRLRVRGLGESERKDRNEAILEEVGLGNVGKELVGSTKVVIFFVILIGIILFGLDVVFGYFFQLIKVLEFGPFQ